MSSFYHKFKNYTAVIPDFGELLLFTQSRCVLFDSLDFLIIQLG